ncbi:MAG: sterol desaturase family protein [Gemmatimonadota bacterium]|nr:sterol desaturase family protein [Gemmatimonadota bacterium]
MADVTSRLAEIAAMAHLEQLAKSTVYAILVYSAFVLTIYLFETRAGADPGRYRSRNFAIDVLYTLFYKGGFYSVLLLAAVTNAIGPRLDFLRLNLGELVPWPIGLALFWVGGDFVTYWWHRLQHAVPFLWAFHSIHHSQEQMTALTASRRHPLENLSMDVILYFFIFNLVLGVPTRGWMPLATLITCIAVLQHAQLDWRFGPLQRVLVGPRFHAFHHSRLPEHANANFGFLFSCWDYLFGTAVPEQARPTTFGVEGAGIRETIGSQLFTPFRLLWQWRRRPASVPSSESHAARS